MVGSCWKSNICTKSIVVEGLVEVNRTKTVAERNANIEPRIIDVLEDLCDVATILGIHGK